MSDLGGAATELPIVVIGAGPVGLVAAAHLVARGESPLILEAGAEVGSSVRRWGHVRLFSPWKYLTDPVSRELLRETGWVDPPGDELPTGAELVARFLEPLAAIPPIASALRTGMRVIAISRKGYDKLKSAGRDTAPFDVIVEGADGETMRILARAVIDASGTYESPNPLGGNGLAARGEVAARPRIVYGIPDSRGADRARYAGRRTLVVGSGHSAFNAVLDLVSLARTERRGEVIWAIRRAEPDRLFGGGAADALPERGRLGARMRQLVSRGDVRLVTGFSTERVIERAQGMVVEGGDQVIGPVDEMIVATGFRPELGMLRELRLGLDSWLESPATLAPLIDPNLHSCGTVYPHGYEELKHPENGFFIAGMKSYGRAPTFLLLTGYEQVRSVVAGLTGDLEAARDVRLVLPETGVCSSGVGGSTCCSTPEEFEPVPLGGSCGIASACATPAPALTVLGSPAGCCS